MAGIDTVVHFAAESHVDRSITGPAIFVLTNVVGTQVLLDAAVKHQVKHFHHISTDEVFGALAINTPDKFSETTRYNPNSPYSASKAGSDHLVHAYHVTYGLITTITNTSNNYGPYQFPEKVIPRFISNLIDNEPIPLFKSSLNKREWIHTEDHCRAIDMILKKGKIGEAYNIGTGLEKSIEEIAEAILKRLGKDDSMKKYIEDRPGHDRRYLLDITKIKNELGWQPKIEFEPGLDEVVEWYKKNEWWWRPLKGKGFVENYKEVKK